MQKLFTLFFLSYLVCPAYAQQVNFIKGTLKDALEEASRTNRYVFMDAYTEKCPPCKVMDVEVFKDEEVASFMNTFFINYKTDPQWNTAVKYKYGIIAYPTLLFLSPDGEVIESRVGGYPKKYFLRFAENAFYKTEYGQVYLQLDGEWFDGNRTPQFVGEYLKFRSSYGMSNDSILTSFLSSQPVDSLDSDQTAKVVVLGTNMMKGPGFDYLIAHKNMAACAEKLKSMLLASVELSIKNKKLQELDSYDVLIQKMESSPWEAALTKGEIKSRYFIENGYKSEFEAFASDFYVKILSPNLKQEILSTDSVRYYRHQEALEKLSGQIIGQIKDKNALQTVFDWLEQANALHTSVGSLGYQAIIADKIGKKEICCVKLETTITTAKKQNLPTDTWEKMQKKCK